MWHHNGMVKEVHYTDCLGNCFVVKKKNGKNRVCIDFTNLNKACLKDSFPLPMIDQLVDGTVGYEMISLFDILSADPHALG